MNIFKCYNFYLLSIIILGAIVRFYDITYNFDGDEVFSVRLVSGTFFDAINQSLLDTPHPPLHNILLFFWVKIFGQSEIAVRCLSVVFSAFFLWVAYFLFRKVADKWICFFLVLILALSPVFIFYGQQARPYALITFLSSLNLLLFCNVLQKVSDTKTLFMWAMSCTAFLYAQYMGALIVAAEMMVALVYLRQGRSAVLIFGFAGSALIFPWIFAAMGSSMAVGVDPLPHISWMQRPEATDLYWNFMSFFGTPSWMRSRWLLLVMFSVMLVYARYVIMSRKLPAMHALLIIVGIGIPLFVFAISVFGPKPVFAKRQLLWSAFACVAMFGVSLSTLRRPLAIIVLTFFLVWLVFALPTSLPYWNERPPWKAMAGFVDQQYADRLLLAQENRIQIPMDYYRKSGVVKIQDDISNLEEDALFLCRSLRCFALNDDKGVGQAVLVKSMPWGREETGLELLLYEVRANTVGSFPDTSPNLGAKK